MGFRDVFLMWAAGMIFGIGITAIYFAFRQPKPEIIRPSTVCLSHMGCCYYCGDDFELNELDLMK